MKNWIVVANAARARVLEEADPPPRGRPAPHAAPFVHVADLVHPASRRKGVDLADDRPGRVVGVGHGLGSGSYVPRTDPRQREHEHFALELARLLDHGVADGRCAGLVLLASNPFLGELKAHLGEQATKVVLRTMAVDWTVLDDRVLAEKLRETAPADSGPGAG
jgi:protein required for attachment to host cells